MTLVPTSALHSLPDAASRDGRPTASFDLLVQAVAAGQCPVPPDLPDADVDRLCDAVQQIRRSRLIRLVARAIAHEMLPETCQPGEPLP
jgi:hypothetical protein